MSVVSFSTRACPYFQNHVSPGLQGNVVEGNDVSGALCLSQAWPGMARTIYGDHQRFMDAYFKAYPGEVANVSVWCLPTHYWNLVLRKPF